MKSQPAIFCSRQPNEIELDCCLLQVAKMIDESETPTNPADGS